MRRVIDGSSLRRFAPSVGGRRSGFVLVGANVLFACGVAFHAFLYNFYLEGLSQSPVVMGRAAAVWSLGGLAVLLPAGRSVDRWGSKPVIISSASCAALALALGAVVASAPAIYGASALAGAAGMSWRVAQAPVLMQMTVPSNRTRVFSLNTAFVVGAGAGATALSGALVTKLQLGWHLERQAALTAILLLGALVTGVSAIAYAMVSAATPTRAHEAVPATSTGVSRDIVLLVGVSGFWMAALTLATPFYNVYFAHTFQLSIEHVSWIFSGTTVATAVLLIGAGEVAARFGARRLFAIWSVLFVPAMFGLAFASGVGVAVGCYLIQNMVSPAANPLLDQILLESAPADRHGVVSSWRQGMASGGSVVAQWVGGSIVAAGSFPALFAWAGGFGLVAGGAAAAAAVRLGRHDYRNEAVRAVVPSAAASTL